MLSRLEYVDACLTAIGAPHDNPRHVSLMTKITYEWGNASGMGPTYNALDLTEHEPGATAFNTFGPNGSYHVWNYTSLEQGAKAFHEILQAEVYAKLLHTLKTAPPTITADAIIALWNTTPWGYCPPVLVEQTRNNFNHYASLLVRV